MEEDKLVPCLRGKERATAADPWAWLQSSMGGSLCITAVHPSRALIREYLPHREATRLSPAVSRHL